MDAENIQNKYIKIDGKQKTYNQIIVENIKASECMRCDINKFRISEERDVFIMLDLALLCISTMTGDKPFYEQNRKKVIDIMCKWTSFSY